MSLANLIKSEARSIGFDACQICRANETWLASDRLQEFIDAGYHGSMDWMVTTLSRRKSPVSMWPEVRSAIVLGLNYGPDHDPMRNLELRQTGNISVYARGRDYHDVVKKKLKRLARWFSDRTGEEVKVFVDTAPLMEKPLAQKSGLGWQGKHTNLVSRAEGSWLFLGVVLTSADLDVDEPEQDHCGNCRACLEVCPTSAFPRPYQLDARRCISYLTIENKEQIPREFRLAMGNRIYGCDDCLAVCPWNKFAKSASESAFWARAELKAPGLDELAALDDASFRNVFSGSPIKRIGRDRFLRNVLIAIGNSGRRELLDQSVLPHLDDPNPVVRGAAVWALSRLDAGQFESEKSKRLLAEPDPSVQEEWIS